MTISTKHKFDSFVRTILPIVGLASVNGRKSEHWVYFASDPIHIVDYVARSVDFANNRVIAWQSSR